MKTTVLVAVLLAFMAIPTSIGHFRESAGVDFYQYWGVAKARQWSHRKLKNPYVEQAPYAAVLNAYAEGSDDARLRKANQYRRELELPQTPLCYTLFTFLPADYSLAFGIFQAGQVVLFIAAMVMLGLALQGNWPTLLSLALLLLIIYQPLQSDLRVGNLNSCQLFALVSLTIFADRFLAGPAGRHRLGPSVAFLGGLVFLTLLKPNLALVTLLLAAHLWARQGIAVLARAALAAAGVAVILVVLPCLQFDSWRVWLDWYTYSRSFDTGKLVSFIITGNYASVLLGAEALGISLTGATLLTAAALLTSGLGALLLSVSPGKRGLSGLGQATVQILRDPYLTAAIGVAVTLALAPLVWLHYYVLSLFPALWLLWGQHRWGLAGVAGGFALLLTSGAVSDALVVSWAWGSWVPYSFALGWIPLWAGVLAAIAFNQKSPTGSDSPVFAKKTAA